MKKLITLLFMFTLFIVATPVDALLKVKNNNECYKLLVNFSSDNLTYSLLTDENNDLDNLIKLFNRDPQYNTFYGIGDDSSHWFKYNMEDNKSFLNKIKLSNNNISDLTFKLLSYLITADIVGMDNKIVKTIIGNISMRQHGKEAAELAIFIDKSFSGKGYATEAIKTILKIITNCVDVKKVDYTYDRPNIGSGKVAEKSGFKINKELSNEREVNCTYEISSQTEDKKSIDLNPNLKIKSSDSMSNGCPQ